MIILDIAAHQLFFDINPQNFNNIIQQYYIQIQR